MADQKLNIIFSGDVTQLNKAVQAAVSDLTKFEQKLKESLGTEAFAGIIQQVDQLKQKLASLATIDIKANPTQALSVIKEVQTGISSLKSSDILLKIDDGKVLQQVQNIDSLLDSLTATVKVSFPDVKSQVDKIRSQLGALTLDINADASGFDPVIKSIQSKLASLSDEKLNISANGEQAETVINEILADLKTLKDAKILINADGTQAEGVIDRIQGELSSLKGSLSVDTTEFQRKLAQITSGVSEINLKADVSEVETAIKSIVGKLQALREINIETNAEGFFETVREISSELASLKDSEVFIKLNDGKVLSQIQNIDKLISSLSTSIKIDANVKTDIDKLKSQLSGLTVKIGADATPAEAAIKNIQSKLALLQDETFIVSADGKQAESVITEIFNDLNTLKDSKVLITADGTPAEDVIDKIRADLKTTLKGNVTIDTADVQRKLSQISEIDINIDSSQIDVVVRSIREKLTGLKAIDIQANPQQALTAINEIFQDIAKIKSSEILLQADNSEALEAINQVQAKVQTIKEKIDVGVNIDTRNLEALIKPLSQKVQISVSTKQAEAEIKALLNQVKNLKGQDILINLDGTQVVRTIDQIEKELLQLQSKLKSATNPADIARLTQSLQVLKNSLSSVGTNQFSSSMSKNQQATFAFSQVLREAPAFAFSFQTGILALSNNLPILADRLKEARAAGLSFGSILGGMAKSLVSLPGILTIASTALIFLGGNLFKSGKEADNAAEKIRSFGEIVDESTSSVAGDVARVNALVQAATDTGNSFKIQAAAIDELRKTNKAYFGDLEAGKSSFEQITKAANDYTQALVQQAIVKGLQDEISNLAKSMRAADRENINLINSTNKAREALAKARRDFPINENARQGIGESIQVREAQVELTKLETKLTKSFGKVGELQRQFNDLVRDINKAVGIQLALKPLETQDFDDSLDDVVARARAFVKQFGETFVVPDLEESFTNTKEIIKKAAIKLLEDVKNLNLKVRVPAKVDVLTEIEVIPILENQKLTENQLKKLTEGFLQDFQTDRNEIDVPIAINIGNIKLLEQVRTIFKSLRSEIPEDIKLKLLDEESFVSFDRLNKAIEKAQFNFQLLQTIGESVGQGLANGFDRVFDALLEGQSVFKALGESVKALVVETIKAIAKMLILRTVTKILSGGVGIPLPGTAGPVGGIANPFSAIGIGSISGRGFVGGFSGGMSLAVTGDLRGSGTDFIGTIRQATLSIGRAGYNG